MAGETTSPFRTPEMMSEQEDNKPRGNSAGKVSSSSSGRKELPHYLRASTGSCHDLCKYGRKHASEEKPWRAKVKKTVKKLPDGVNIALSSGGSPETKKITAVNKKQVLDCANDASEIIKREVVKSSGSVSNAVKKSPPSEQRDSLEKKKKITSSKLKSSPVLGYRTSGNANTQEQKAMSRSHSGRAMLKSKETKPTQGEVSSLRLKPVTAKASGGKDSLKIEKKIGAPKVASRKVSVTPRASFSPKPSVRFSGNSSLRKSQSLKVSSSAPNQKPSYVQSNDIAEQLDIYPVEEKTLHVVETEAESYKLAEHNPNEQCIVEPSPPPSSSSTQKDEDLGEYEEYTVSEAEEYDYPSGSNEPESTEEEEGMTRGRNEGDSADEARKLHFRRGRVVDVTSENGSPRRLKFRRGRAVGGNQSENGHGRRSFKRRDDIAEENDNHSGEKVVLRHQDVQDKKDAQGLFNNVIEETASKLAETRKSKVKALVGAFETVISLQESKPPNSAT